MVQNTDGYPCDSLGDNGVYDRRISLVSIVPIGHGSGDVDNITRGLWLEEDRCNLMRCVKS